MLEAFSRENQQTGAPTMRKRVSIAIPACVPFWLYQRPLYTEAVMWGLSVPPSGADQLLCPSWVNLISAAYRAEGTPDSQLEKSCVVG